MAVFHFWILVFGRLCYLSLTTQDANETTTSLATSLSSTTTSAPVTTVTVLQERPTEGRDPSSSWLVVLLFILSVVFFIISSVLLLQKYKIWPFNDGKLKKINNDIENKKMAEYRNFIFKLGKDTEMITGSKKDSLIPTTTTVTVSSTPASSSAVPKGPQSNSGFGTSSTITKSTEITVQPSPATSSTLQATTTTPTATTPGQPLVTVIVTGDQVKQTPNVKTDTKNKKSESDDDKLAKVGKSASKVFQTPESVERFYSISEAKPKEANRENSEVI